MLIQKDRPYLWRTKEIDDKVVFTHVQNVDAVRQSAQEIREFSNNGFTADKEFQQIARIPELEAIKHPEIFTDETAMKRYLQNEGRDYCTCNPAGI